MPPNECEGAIQKRRQALMHWKCILKCADILIKIKFFKYKEDRLWRQYSVSKKEEA